MGYAKSLLDGDGEHCLGCGAKIAYCTCECGGYDED